MKFKVGDKVRVVKVNNEIKDSYIGKELVIKSINPNDKYGTKKHSENHYGFENCVFVFWDNELIPADNQKIVITTDGKETIARLYDGDVLVKSASAKCSPEDTFDFETGARIAFDRLVGEKPSDFEIGERYEYKSGLAEGIIEIVDHHDNWYYWKTIEGMNGWDFKKFQKNSDFARTLKRIEKPKYYNGKVICVDSKYPNNLTRGKIYRVVDGVLTYDSGKKSPLIKSFEDLLETISRNFIELVE